MEWTSTRDSSHVVDLRTALFASLAPDGGLYVPREIDKLSPIFFEAMRSQSLAETAAIVLQQFFTPELSLEQLRSMAERAFSFPAPLRTLDERTLDERTRVLELFHGPTLAFKDFAARWIAELLSYFSQNDARTLTVLVATSGDTGGAVAAGFAKVPGVRVVILYPKGRVSAMQELQLTTCGDNVRALAVDGTFDDCQALVKRALSNVSLRNEVTLASANSINIARWIPQCVYYFEAMKQLPEDVHATFVVPSGNFGNLAAGLLATRLGLPIEKFIAATNANDAIPRFLSEGVYLAQATVATISNAMDVGNPSNSERIFWLTGADATHADPARKWLYGHISTDLDTRRAMREAFATTGYAMDPHTAVAWHAWHNLRDNQSLRDTTGVLLSTAHPAKFFDEVSHTLGQEITMPEALLALRNHPARTQEIANEDYALTQVLRESC